MAVFALALYVKFIPIPQNTSLCDEGCEETQRTTIIGFMMKLISKNYPEPYVYTSGGSDGERLPI